MGTTPQAARRRTRRLKIANCTVCGAELIVVMVTSRLRCEDCYRKMMGQYNRGEEIAL
jgi:hypothetical protein